MVAGARIAVTKIGPEAAKQITRKFCELTAKQAAKKPGAKEFVEGAAKEGISRVVLGLANAAPSSGAIPSSAAGSVEGILRSSGFSSAGAARLMSGSLPESSSDRAIFLAGVVALGIVAATGINALRRYMSGEEKEPKKDKTANIDDLD